MPKQKITKEMVIEAAFALARNGGTEKILVKSIAEKLGCSVQPIYSYCKSMEGLRQEVAERTRRFVREYVAAHIDQNDLFRSTGYAYLRLAQEEPHLFQMFILHKREGLTSLEELYRSETNPALAGSVAESLGISVTAAKRLHLHMLIYTTGIGTILATTLPGMAAEEIAAQLESAHQAFLKQIVDEEKQNDK
jgi:AcrR family transcriptional regulator